MKRRQRKYSSNSALMICALIIGTLLIFVLFSELASAGEGSALGAKSCADGAAPEAPPEDGAKPADIAAEAAETDKKPKVILTKSAEERYEKAHKLRMKAAPTRAFYAQIILPESKNKPLLILLPGNVRALNTADNGIKALINRGFGVASKEFSQLPFSIANSPKEISDPFHDPRPTMDDLLSEVTQFVDFVKETYPDYKTIVPVSLSYSGIVSPNIKGYDLIIETVPMTSTDAASPFGASAAKIMDMMGIFMFPWGKSMMESQIDNAARMAISASMKSGFASVLEKEHPDRFNDMVEGSFNLHKIAEGLEWAPDDPNFKGTRRVFILAEKESSSLLRHQLKTFKRLSEIRDDALLILVKGAEHVLPNSNPKAYALAIQLALSPKFRGKSAVLTVDENSDTETVLSPEEIEKLLGP